MYRQKLIEGLLAFLVGTLYCCDKIKRKRNFWDQRYVTGQCCYAEKRVDTSPCHMGRLILYRSALQYRTGELLRRKKSGVQLRNKSNFIVIKIRRTITLYLCARFRPLLQQVTTRSLGRRQRRDFSWVVPAAVEAAPNSTVEYGSPTNARVDGDRAGTYIRCYKKGAVNDRPVSVHTKIVRHIIIVAATTIIHVTTARIQMWRLRSKIQACVDCHTYTYRVKKIFESKRTRPSTRSTARCTPKLIVTIASQFKL